MARSLRDVPPAKAFGLKYDHKHNEFAGKDKPVALYAAVRRPFVENKTPVPFPKEKNGKPGMFSIEQRARFVQ